MPTTVEKTETTHSFKEGDEVIVLYGYGKVHPASKQYVDNILFEGGVARHVPYSKALQWKQGKTAEGKPSTSRVYIQAILPDTASETDFAREVGLGPQLEGAKMAALLNSLSPEEVLQALGPAKARDFVARLGGGK